MNRAGRLTLAGGLLLFWGIAWWWYSSASGVAPGREAARSGMVARAASATPNPSQVSAERSVAPPPRERPIARIELPPKDAPLASVFPALAEAARAGDVGAECRVAIEIYRCTRELEAQRERVRSLQALSDEKLGSEDRSGRDGYLARTILKLEQTEAICAGVKIPADLEPWRLLRDAARAGHVPSMLRYVTDYPLNKQELLQHLGQLAVYRDEAPVFLQRAAASGDPYGAAAMYWALQGQPGFLMPGFEPVRRDPMKLLAYNLALRDVLDARGKESIARMERMLRRKLPDAAERDAERQAVAIAATLSKSRGMDMGWGLEGTFTPGSDCARP